MKICPSQFPEAKGYVFQIVNLNTPKPKEPQENQQLCHGQLPESGQVRWFHVRNFSTSFFFTCCSGRFVVRHGGTDQALATLESESDDSLCVWSLQSGSNYTHLVLMKQIIRVSEC